MRLKTYALAAALATAADRPAAEVLLCSLGRSEHGPQPGTAELGRCLAERYETRRAIAQFRAALALDPNDLDAHLALLAEYSVLAHMPTSRMPAAERGAWEQAFVDQFAQIRSRFGTRDEVRRVEQLLFRFRLEDLPAEQRADEARLRRIGFAVLRWKQR